MVPPHLYIQPPSSTLTQNPTRPFNLFSLSATIHHHNPLVIATTSWMDKGLLANLPAPNFFSALSSTSNARGGEGLSPSMVM